LNDGRVLPVIIIQRTLFINAIVNKSTVSVFPRVFPYSDPLSEAAYSGWYICIDGIFQLKFIHNFRPKIK
jgi:hypothetical protein